MHKPPLGQHENTSHQISGGPPTSEKISAMQEGAAENVGSVYRFVNKSTEDTFPGQQVYHEAPELKIGDVVEIQAPKSKPEYYCVDSMEEGDITTVYLVRARNSLWKSFLILAILGVSWFIIDYFVKLIF